MKLKSSPEDFCVEELTDVRTGGGAHALYRLTKTGMGTPEAVQAILHQWNLPRHALSYGGLKDRHAMTSQHVSIRGGPRGGVRERSFELEYLGQIARPFAASDIRGNRFRIRLRGLSREQRNAFDLRIDNTRTLGLINYFDDQRFGSIGVSGDLIGVAWCKGDYERALYLALAEPNSHDRPREKEQKEILRTNWGDWLTCKQCLDRSHRRSVVTYLVDHPLDYKRALALVRQDLRGIYAAAFQSWVWNRWVSRLIEDQLGDAHVNHIPSRSGALAVPSDLQDELASVWARFAHRQLPLPSARIHEWPDGTLPALEGVLEPLSMTVREMRFKYPRDTFFSKGMRSVRLVPEELSWRWESEDRDRPVSDGILGFTLPRGCYATMAIRQWTLVEGTLEEPDDESHAEEG